MGALLKWLNNIKTLDIAYTFRRRLTLMIKEKTSPIVGVCDLRGREGVNGLLKDEPICSGQSRCATGGRGLRHSKRSHFDENTRLSIKIWGDEA